MARQSLAPCVAGVLHPLARLCALQSRGGHLWTVGAVERVGRYAEVDRQPDLAVVG